MTTSGFTVRVPRPGVIRAYAVLFSCSLGSISLPAQTFATLANFSAIDGGGVQAGLAQGADGNFYGTGSSHGDPSVYGNVFKTTPGGTVTVLHNFDGTDGSDPTGSLLLAADGNFYGTTVNGGAVTSKQCPHGCGTVFKITPVGMLTTLHSFDFADGFAPLAALTQGNDGNFYGSTTSGGASNNCQDGCGTIFAITPDGTLTTLHSFDFTDGASPGPPLILGADGDFYGTALGGASDNCSGGCGTVFKITPGGTLTTLQRFNGADGNGPNWLAVGDGTFYGTTFQGGTDNYGTVFELTPQGALTTLHTFDFTDGAFPEALTRATDGNFYGIAFQGAITSGECNPVGCGVIFEITPPGTLTTLHSFDGTDGGSPLGRLLEATNGTFYGATYAWGADGLGTIFSLSVGLKPFVKPLPHMGKVGAPIQILGNDLAGTTGVSFNGTPATFTVVSATEITTTVPVDATTGYLLVVTPGGTLSSGGTFVVHP